MRERERERERKRERETHNCKYLNLYEDGKLSFKIYFIKNLTSFFLKSKCQFNTISNEEIKELKGQIFRRYKIEVRIKVKNNGSP